MHDLIVDTAKATGLLRSEVRKQWEQAKVDAKPRGKGVKAGGPKHIDDALKLFHKRMAPHAEAFAKQATPQVEAPEQPQHDEHEQE